MEPEVNIFKSSQRTTRIPSTMLDIQYLVKLYAIISEINKEAAELESNKLIRQEGQSQEDFDKLKKYVKSLYQVSVQIVGAKGEFIASQSGSVLSETNLPDYINTVTFDNSIYYKHSLQNKEPQNKIVVHFDASKPNIFDFSSNPSCATPNVSYIQVMGESQTWVEGAHEKIMSSLEGRKTNMRWIHNQSYDFLLWFFIMPIAIINLYKIDKVYANSWYSISPVFQVAIYLYFFITAIVLFRIFFNYTRWVYPYLEISTSARNVARQHRLFHSAVLLGLIGNFIYDIMKYVLD